LNAGMGDLIKRQLLKNPNSTLFSRGNMALRRDDGVLKLIFADPKNLPLRDTAVKYELILDKRLGRPSNFDGSRIVEILKNQEFEFNSLSDFCRKMTMCEHLNFTQITTAEALATILTADPKHPIIYKPELVEQINMLVSQECGTQKYCSNHAFDIKKGIEYWTSSTVDTQESQPASWENTAGQRTVANMSEGKQQPDAGRRSTDNTPAGIISPSAMPRNAFGPLPLNPGANHPHQAQKAISELQTERSPNSNMNPHPIIVRDGANGSRDVVQPGSNANDKSKKPQIAPKPPGKLVGTQWSRGEVSGKK